MLKILKEVDIMTDVIDLARAAIWTSQVTQKGQVFHGQIRLKPCSTDGGGPLGTYDSDCTVGACFGALCDVLKIKREDYTVSAEWFDAGRAQNLVLTMTKGTVTKVARGRAPTKSKMDLTLAEAMLFALKQIEG